ncbi:MAG: nucleotidyltransferase family protein [Gammaproteobacteria bacterium]
MPERTPGLDLPEQYLETVKRLLQERVPDAELWAYGSRISGAAHAASDLDLVLRTPDRLGEETPALSELRQALVESNLPIRVDVTDWARIPERFHREIERRHVVVQRGRHP